jgi:hypothetical protein
MAGPASVVGLKPRWIDDRVAFLGVAGEGRERDRAALARGSVARLVLEDPEEPVLERGALLEAVDALKRDDPGLLDDLLGDCVAGAEGSRESLQRAVMAAKQVPEGLLVARPELCYQPLVVQCESLVGMPARS